MVSNCAMFFVFLKKDLDLGNWKSDGILLLLLFLILVIFTCF